MNRIYHVISNTHWDREWRFTFQRNRQMLVDMIDRVLAILKSDPDYRAFHLDSQSIVIKDYLEIKPHREDEITELVKQNRLFIGPWYILPEEFQVGGENLIRNLLLGHKVAERYGRSSKIGYSPFSWGQISQLPQIYKEFDIDLIMFYRGINSLDSPKAEFLWEGADGTRSISSRFSTMPRYNFYFYIYRPVAFNEGFYDVEYKWDRNTRPVHSADKEQYDEDYSIKSPTTNIYSENVKSQVEKIITDQAHDFTTENVIWMEGHDSSGPTAVTTKIINEIKMQMPELNVIHSTLEDYAKELSNSVAIKKLKLVKGERRTAQYNNRSGNLYGYTTSARMYLKQKNFDAERWIQFYAEPFNVFSAMIGRDINDQYTEQAWELIIQNSAHDSIGGCSLDEIHEDMMNRYKHSIEISKGLFSRAVSYIVKNIDTAELESAKKEEDIFLVAFNPNNYKRTEVVKAFIDIPNDYDTGSIKIISKSGNLIESEILNIAKCQPVVEQMIDRPMYFEMTRYEVLLKLKDLPPFGYNTFRVLPTKIKKSHKQKSIASEKSNIPVLENDCLSIKVNSDGTINLHDKINSKFFEKIGYFYDEGEAGHAWVNVKTDPFVSTLNSSPKIVLEKNNTLSATIKISHILLIPKNLSERKKKNTKSTKLKIDLFVTLMQNSRKVDLSIRVNNTAESHRLRIMFPTNLDIKDSFGEGQFDVVKRTTNRIDSKEWIEQPMYDFPMHHFVDVADNKNGFAVLIDGLKEYEIIDDRNKTLAITLLRGFEYIIEPSSKQNFSNQKGSQCLGLSEYNMALYPHAGNWQQGEVYKEALNFNNSIRLIETGSGRGELQLSHSFMKITNENIIFSCLKKPECPDNTNYIIRVYNPTSSKQKGQIVFGKKLLSVYSVSLEEKMKEEIKLLSKNSFNIELEKKKIITYAIAFNENNSYK